jgi:hypothetical protein
MIAFERIGVKEIDQGIKKADPRVKDVVDIDDGSVERRKDHRQEHQGDAIAHPALKKLDFESDDMDDHPQNDRQRRQIKIQGDGIDRPRGIRNHEEGVHEKRNRRHDVLHQDEHKEHERQKQGDAVGFKAEKPKNKRQNANDD